MNGIKCNPQEILEKIATPIAGMDIFDRLPDVVFSVKDAHMRYVAVNKTFAQRAGADSKLQCLGKTAEDLFPAHLAENYTYQDSEILRTGAELIDRLELIISPEGNQGWHLTQKSPLYDRHGNIIGILSVSQDLRAPNENDIEFSQLADTVSYIQKNLRESLHVEDLAQRSGLSASQLDRRLRNIFRLSTKQFIIQTRVNAAIALLVKTDMPLARIAAECGFYDQSAFTRQMKQTTAMTPGEYRSTHAIPPYKRRHPDTTGA